MCLQTSVCTSICSDEEKIIQSVAAIIFSNILSRISIGAQQRAHKDNCPSMVVGAKAGLKKYMLQLTPYLA